MDGQERKKKGRLLALGRELPMDHQFIFLFPSTFPHNPYNSPSTNTQSDSLPLNGVPTLTIFPLPS
jgi:hypothetical protein